MGRKKKDEGLGNAASSAKRAAKDVFVTGSAGFNKKKQQDAAAASAKERGVQRFRLKEGESAEIVFVDSTSVSGDGEIKGGFFLPEHNLQIGGRWGNFMTCTKDIEPCEICDAGNKSVYTCYFTIIDTRKFTRTKGRDAGKESKNRKILFPAKGSTIARIQNLIQKHKNLSGLKFKVTRLSADDPNCGSDFEKLGKVDLAKALGKDALRPIDYRKVLARPSEEELAVAGFGGTGPVPGSSTDVGGTEEPSTVL